MTESTSIDLSLDAPTISAFEIRGLYGVRDYTIPIEGNCLVLVGENGTGKSTVVTMLNLLLSAQWTSLARYTFATVSVTLDNERISVSHDEIEAFLEERQLVRRMSPHLRRVAASEIEQLSLLEEDLDGSANRLADRLGVSSRAAARLIEESRALESKAGAAVRSAAHRLNSLFDVSVLFLPTYRRIERDLTEILPHLDQDQQARRERDRLRKVRPSERASHVELVEFGMEDVERLMSDKMLLLREQLRRALDALTGEYLRDVLRKAYKDVDLAPVRSLGEGTLEGILARIDEHILPSQDKSRLHQTIERIGRTDHLEEEDTVVAHFLSKIIQLHSEQGERERSVRSFAAVCNKYLSGKRVTFDNSDFSLRVVSQPEEPELFPDFDETEIGLSVLSSGEKQIVSLFAHVYLSSEAKKFFVIIDEPELSLSVPWQRTFLPDLAQSGYCVGLVAVTHSPFIFDNAAMARTHSLREFVEYSQ